MKPVPGPQKTTARENGFIARGAAVCHKAAVQEYSGLNLKYDYHISLRGRDARC